MQYPTESMLTTGMSHSRSRLRHDKGREGGRGEAMNKRRRGREGRKERVPGVEERDVVERHEDLALRRVFCLRAHHIP
jgi:hypothetical protein